VQTTYDGHGDYLLRVGQVVQFDVAAVQGQRPEVRICGYVDKGAGASALRQLGGESSTRFRAAATGTVDLCGVPRQAVDKCRRLGCIEGPIDDYRPMATIRIHS
jgi:hypothetical protein